MALPVSCRLCGKVAPAGNGGLCPTHREAERAAWAAKRGLASRQERGYDAEYDHNRKVMIDITWNRQHPCWICDKPFEKKSDITADHIKQKVEGGGNELANLAPAHDSCNKSRNQLRRHGKRPERPAPKFTLDTFKSNNDFLDW